MPVIPDVMPWIQESFQKSSQNTLTFVTARALDIRMPLLERYQQRFYSEEERK